MEEFWEFVEANASIDTAKLRLKYHGRSDMGFDVQLAITQIECRRKFSKKFAETLRRKPRFLFPSMLACEQATSDVLADYHATLIEGSRVIDLTAGLGIDALHFSDVAKNVVAVELDHQRAACLCENLAPEDNIKVVEGDCRDFVVESESNSVDTIFIDPARRSDDGGRIFDLSQCRPDVVSMLPQISKIGRRLVVKMSPMMDVVRAAAQLHGIRRVIAVGTPSECRELVAVVDFGYEGEFTVEAVTLTNETKSVISFTKSEEDTATPSYGVPSVGDFIYEPFPSVMKVAPFRLLCSHYRLKTLAPNSHVWFGDKGIEEFPGRSLEIEAVLPWASSVIKRFKRDYPVAEIVCRNFDMTPEKLRKKLAIADSDCRRLIATRDCDGNQWLIVAKR